MSESKPFSARGGLLPLAFLLALAALQPVAHGQWVEFSDVTGTVLSVDPALGASDPDEKDYAWGDVDNDGDFDLVIVRKEPFTSAGRRTNLLLLNEFGLLVDRTADFATDSTVPGDQGFLTPTNDRDVLLVDVDADGFLDIVTAVTISDGEAVHIGHPRIYMNKGLDSGSGDWLGFRYEDDRIPTMNSYTGSPANPRFCSVSAGDVTGDGFPELYFGDYDSSGAGGNNQPPNADFNDRLLINDGTGYFTDQTQSRFIGSVPGINARFEVSAFGAANAIADINGDGRNDIVKQTSLSQPLYVGVAYNDSLDEGFFDTYDVVNQLSPYFVSVGDLNKDGKLDLVITDDGADRYLINTGNNAGNVAEFISFVFSYDEASDDGFGGNSVIADLNKDDFNDVLITDIDVDIPGCDRRMHIYRNLGGAPGSNVTLREQTSGTGCATSDGNPSSCIVASIPADQLEGVHDVAVFDINGDTWLDMVVGRCSGTEVYLQDPPTGLAFNYPDGLPFFVAPGADTVFQVQIDGIGGSQPSGGTGRIFVSVDGGAFTESNMADLGDGLYEATLPASAGCTSSVDFYFVVEERFSQQEFFDPPQAPTQTYNAIAAYGTVRNFEDGFEGEDTGWTVANDATLTTGAWERVEPVGTLTGSGQQAAPDEDAEAAVENVMAYVTQNGAPGGAVGEADVDGGPTDLLSPVIDLQGTDGTVSFSRWFFSESGTPDTLTVWVTDDGVDWQLVETLDGANNNSWQVSSFRVGDYVTPSDNVRVRFRTGDFPSDSITEGAIDLFSVDEFVCSLCQGAGDCDDGVFCNGVEQCIEGFCAPGDDPCPQACDEPSQTCVECVTDGDCSDGLLCNGVEVCIDNVCNPGSDPCPGQVCDEGAATCLDCFVDADCDDGLFCNGVEICVGDGDCSSSGEACPGLFCDEETDTCLGNVTLQPRMGEPLLGLTGLEQDRFAAGKVAFDQVLTPAEGLGPIFNQNSCGSCHNNPLGGSGTITVTRFGFSDDKAGGFDPLADLGGSLLQSESISAECAEVVPTESNVTALRVTNSTLGFGLVENVSDGAIRANELSPPPGVSGRTHNVNSFESGGLRVGRFGWKSQVATVLDFAADASLNEMGLTNRFIGTENAPNGDDALLATCDTVPDPEDGPDGEGLDFIDRVTDFQRFLAPPPQTPRSGMTGEALFSSVGCADCHVASFTTISWDGLPEVLRSKPLKPYSDFLLHDMGQAADFIEQGDAGARELRTAPLWGVRVRDPLWHDGRVAGGTFEDRILGAITQHDSLNSEAQASAQAFASLSPEDKDALVAFMDSLGRAEFDHDGDNDVDAADFAVFDGCRDGAQGYTADDPCAISDVDQDGDVDDDDFTLFQAAAEGVSGSVPDGGSVPGAPLTVSKAAGGAIMLSWDVSCLAGDVDYAIYEGTVGDYASHQSLVCSTGGATTQEVMPSPDDRYYLVVPTNGFREGAYGEASDGTPRPSGAAACLPQAIGACL
jgi:CxxC motif-containing protein (DUF1111 family)